MKTVFGLILSITIIYCFNILNNLGLFKQFNQVNFILLGIFYMWFCIFILYIYSNLIEKKKLLLIKESKKKILFYIFGGVTIFAFAVILHISLKYTLEGLKLVDKIKPTKIGTLDWNKNKILFYALIITVAFYEEILFRGFIQTRLKIFFSSKYYSILLSAIIFSLSHIFQFNLLQLIGTFLTGLLFSYLYEKYKSITLLIIGHFLIDGVSI